MTQPDDPYGDEALAAEYVLHLLDAEDRRSFERRLLAEPDLRALVHRWEAEFAGLSTETPEVTPPARVKSAVLEAVAPRPSAPVRSPSRFWGMLAGGIAAIGLAVLLVLTLALPEGGDPAPRFQAELASEDRALVLVAAVTEDAREIRVEMRAGRPPEGRVLELWLIAQGADAPVSLGVLASGGTTRLDLPPALAALVPTGTLAISDEPPGGSPTGAPTGTVLAAASLTTL